MPACWMLKYIIIRACLALFTTTALGHKMQWNPWREIINIFPGQFLIPFLPTNSNLLSMLLYDCENWLLKTSKEKQLDSVDTKCLRKILGIKWGDFVSKEEVRQTANQRPVIRMIWLGCSSVGRASDRRATDAGSFHRCGKGFFSQSQLSVQTLLRCPYTPMRNHMRLHLCARWRSRSPCQSLVDYGNTEAPSMHHRLVSMTLLQLAFPGEGNPNFPWKKSNWDNTTVKSFLFKYKKVKVHLWKNSSYQILQENHRAILQCTSPMPILHSWECCLPIMLSCLPVQ